MFQPSCPDCGTRNNVHERDCEYDLVSIHSIEKAYYDVLSVLANESSQREAKRAPPGVSYSTLVSQVGEMLPTGDWRSIHDDVLRQLKNERRVDEDEAMGGLYLMKPEQREREIIPSFDPVRTVYEHGPIDGCKDYAVYTMVSWCEYVGLSWEQTSNFIHEWLDETGAWEEQSWGENSVDELLNDKRHIHERGLGWAGLAEVAKETIDESNHEPRIDADRKQSQIGGKEDYE